MEKIKLQEFEHNIYLGYSPDAVEGNEEKIPQAKEFVNNIKNSIEGFTFCIANFRSLTNKEVEKFTIDLIIYWLQKRFTEIPSELIPGIFEILSNIDERQIRKNGPEFSELIAEAQAVFTMKTYIELCPNIISTFCQFANSKVKNVIFLRYVSHLFQDFTTPSPLANDNHARIFHQMNEDGSLQGICEIMSKEIVKGTKFSIDFLLYLSRVSNIPFLSIDFLKGLSDDLDDKDKDKNIPLIYLNILRMISTPEEKIGMITALGLNELFPKLVVEESPYHKIIIANFGTLLSYCGFCFPDESSYYALALQYGSGVSDKITFSVLHYINSFTINHIEALQTTLEFAMRRLVNNISKNFDSDTPIVESLLQIIVNCFAINQVIGEQCLSALISSQSDLLSEFPTSLASLLILNSLLKMNIGLAHLTDYLTHFLPLFAGSLTQPLFDQPHSALNLALFQLLLSIKTKDSSVDPKQLFQGLIPFAVTENCYQNKFAMLLVSCCLKFGVQLAIEESHLQMFTSVVTPGYGAILGSLIHCVPLENQAAVVNDTITKIANAIQTNEDKIPLINYSLSLLSTLSCPFEVSCLTTVANFIQAIISIPFVQENDDLLAKAIKGITSLNLSGAQLLLHLYPNINSISSLTAIADLARSVRDFALNSATASASEDPALQLAFSTQWIPDFANFLIMNLKNLSDSAVSYDKNVLGDYFSLVTAVVLFVRKVLTNLPPEQIVQLASILIEAIGHFYDSSALNEAVLIFALDLASLFNPEISPVLLNFVQVSLNFIYSDPLNLLTKQWIRVLIRIIKFYQKLNSFMSEQFLQVLAQVVQSLGGSESTLAQFISALTTVESSQMLLNNVAIFCADLLTTRKYI